MNRQHRQERNKRAGHQYRKDVAEVRTGGHIQIFNDVAEGLTAFDHPFFQHHQIFFQQNNIRGFSCDIHSRIDRNPYISGFHGTGVIDPITQKPSGVPIIF
ncbi:hypothetical protein SDC9_209722 [bioreactor metagenome]|uniref:Uncharacterized protein n=1 Tax=bioreactor metagenome TaxID=1076179 RepID=A0A645JES7_9ZZZZ